MQKPPLALSDLLAHRDGEPLDLDVANEIEASPEAREMLNELRAIKHELRELPGIEPPPATWRAIREGGKNSKRSLRFPLATAAGVFLATALGIMLMNPFGGGNVSNPVLMESGEGLAGLMIRSQQLESEILLPAGFGVGSPSQQAVVYRIADVDAELLRLSERNAVDPYRQIELWRTRVELLQNLQTVQRGQALLRPAVY